MLILFIIALFIVSDNTITYGQNSPEPTHKLIEFERVSGFISRNIRDLAVDNTGYAWLATDRGVVRFDGNHFFQFNVDNVEIFFSDAAVDYLKYHDQKIYLTSKTDGLISIDTKTFETKLLIDEGVHSIAIDELNSILYVYTIKNRLLEMIDGQPVRETAIGSDSGQVEVTDQGIYLLIRGQGVYYADRESFEWINLSLTYNYPRPVGFKEEILRLNDDDVLININRKLIHIKSDPFTPPLNTYPCIDTNEYLVLESKSTIAQTEYEGYYICGSVLYKGRLGERNEGDVVMVLPSNLDTKRIMRINENDLLLATNQGLVRLKHSSGFTRSVDDSSITTFTTPRVRRAIVEMHNQELLLLGNPEIFVMQRSGYIEPVNSMYRFYYFDAVRAEDHIYATTEGQGLVKLNNEGEVIQYTLNDEHKDNIFTSISRLNKDEFIVGSKGMVSIVDRNLIWKRDIPLSTISNHIQDDDNVMDIHIDNQGRGIWFATDSGLSLFDDDFTGEIRFYSNSDTSTLKLNNRSISTLLQSESGDTLWIGGEKGIDIIDVNKLLYIQFVNNWDITMDNRVTGLLKDYNNNIWASTYDGIIVWRKTDNSVITIDSRSGLINQEYNYKSFTLTHDGMIILGGTNGYDIIDPRIIEGSYNSSVYLTEVAYYIMDGRVLEPYSLSHKTKSNQISYRTDKEYLRLYFSVLDLFQAENYILEYRINDSPWIRVDSSNSILLNNFAYGVYNINVRARNPLGIIVENDLQVEIKADLPIYYRSGYQISSIIFLSLLVFGFLLYWVLNFQREAKIKDNISMDLHDNVGTSLTRSVLLLQECMDPNDKLQLRVLSNLKESQFTLRSFISTMPLHKITYEELITETRDLLLQMLSDKIQYQIHDQVNSGFIKTISGDLYRDIKNSLYELCTNVLKHAHASKVEITIRWIKDHLIIEFKDNGIVKDLSVIHSDKGYGLKNLNKRLKRHNGKLEADINEIGHGLKLILAFKIPKYV